MKLNVNKTIGEGGKPDSYSFADASTVSNKLFGIFENSVRSIVKKLDEPSGEYTAAGLQELNNTQKVYELTPEVLVSYKLICSNVCDGYFGTFPTLGYLIPNSSIELKKNTKNIDPKLVYCGGKPNNNVGEFIEISDANINKCYSIVQGLSHHISIRDLGTIEETNGHYLLRDNNKSVPKPDSGRPISMIIVNPDGANPIIHLNCHMPNPSLLKVFTKTDDAYTPLSQYVIKGPDDVAKIDSNGNAMLYSILQVGDSAHTSLWVTYCKNRLKTTIEAMLDDFGITSLGTPYDNAMWIITGDFNDATGELMTELESGGVNIFGTDIIFKFGKEGEKFPITCCVNTNSSLPNSNGKPASEKALGVKTKDPFNKAFAYLTYISKPDTVLTSGEQKDKDILDTNFTQRNEESSVLNPDNFAFSGDNVGFSHLTIKSVRATSIDEGTSDHSFVLCSASGAPPSSKGGSRRRRRSSKRNRTRKQKRSKRRRRR